MDVTNFTPASRGPVLLLLAVTEGEPTCPDSFSSHWFLTEPLDPVTRRRPIFRRNGNFGDDGDCPTFKFEIAQTGISLYADGPSLATDSVERDHTSLGI